MVEQCCLSAGSIALVDVLQVFQAEAFTKEAARVRARAPHSDPDTFFTEPAINWSNPTEEADVLGIKGSRSVMLAALRLRSQRVSEDAARAPAGCTR